MALHPVGPLPASTYWRRRLVLLLALVLVVLLLRSCTGDAAPARRATPQPTATPTPTATASATQRATTAPPATVLCPDGALTLTTDTDAEEYTVGATPRITLTIANSSKQPCRRDLGAGAVELLVMSGADRVWSSDDCSPSKAVAVTTLGTGGTQAVVKTWPGVRSKPACAGSKAQALPGTYRVVARVGTLRVEGAVFRLRG